MFKIATWNVNSIKLRLEQLLPWMDSLALDVVAVQETKTTDDKFPQQEIEEAGFEVIYSGQKSFNGMAILSRIPAKDVVDELPGIDNAQKRLVAATFNEIRVINVYVPNGQSVDSEKYVYKLAWLNQLTIYLRAQLQRYPNLIVLGDFNIAPEDRDVHDPGLWEGKVLCSEAERKAFWGLIELGLVDAFRLFEQPDKSFTWWDYRMLAFRRNHGLRIDHMLLSKPLADKCQACIIDKTLRKLDRPSDHTPLVAYFT